MLELCRVAASAYGSLLCTALRAIGGTDEGEVYYCGVSERANDASVRQTDGGTCAGLRCCWGVIERVSACVWGLRRMFLSAGSRDCSPLYRSACE